MKLRRDWTYRYDPGLVLAEEELEKRPLDAEDAEAMLHLLAEEFGVPVPRLQVKNGMRGGYYNATEGIICFGPARITEASVLHEFTHHLRHFRDAISALNDVHSVGFCRDFRRVLKVWGVEAPWYKPYNPRFNRRVIIREIADRLGCKPEEVKVQDIIRAGDRRELFVTTPAGDVCAVARFGREAPTPYFGWHVATVQLQRSPQYKPAETGEGGEHSDQSTKVSTAIDE